MPSLILTFQDALGTCAGQAFGAGNHRLLGDWYLLSTAVHLVCMPAVGLAWYFSRDVLSLMGPYADIDLELTQQYTRIAIFGLPAFMLSDTFGRYLQAMKTTAPQLCVAALFVGVNLILNVVLISGVGSFPGFGYIGSPMATAISRWGQFVTLLIMMFGFEFARAPQWPVLRLSKRVLEKKRVVEFCYRQGESR